MDNFKKLIKEALTPDFLKEQKEPTHIITTDVYYIKDYEGGDEY